MSEKRHLPAFTSEAEEAQWWFDNRDARSEEFAQAVREGRASDGSKRRLAVAASTPIKLDLEDARVALSLAGKANLDYSSYIKGLIHQALLREAETLEHFKKWCKPT
jgi:hypothetical protein